jgi:protein-L-isoaspartate(D-aspartate) O-methyltransferase
VKLRHRRPGRAALILLFLATATRPVAAQRDPYAAARNRMVETEIVAAGIRDPRVVDSIRNTPRHQFMPLQKRELAYFDMAVPIGYQQTISPPYVVAYMTEQLALQPTDKVLEIGTGSGYQAAVLSPLVRDVYTIEIVEPLGKRAASTLRRLGYENVHTKIGDGYQGWPDHAPFDAIIVTCSPEDIPPPLVDQLAEGGRIVIPIGERFQQSLCRFTKRDGQLQREVLQGTFFVPMTGTAEAEREVKPEAPFTPLEHTSFEETLGNEAEPRGWYYVRQGRVEPSDRAPSGRHVLTFRNETPGRNAHGMQAFGVDGRQVRQLELTAYVRGENLRPGQNPSQQAQVFVEFYDALRAPVGSALLGPFTGTFDWRQQVSRVRVPLRARLAVVGIGLFGGTGTIAFDAVQFDLPRGR